MADLAPGSHLAVSIERPAAGGWMIARVEGRIVLVSGAIPGERVAVRVDRLGKGVAYARTVGVEIASPDRVATGPSFDPACGGCLYAHIAYPRQLEVKAQVIADALHRIGRVDWSSALAVAGSHTDGYRMRARLHVQEGRAGFFREGTNELCDARATRQLLPAALDAVERLLESFARRGLRPSGVIEVAEDVRGSQRVVHLELAPETSPARVVSGEPSAGLTGLTSVDSTGGRDRIVERWGSPYVSDTLTVLGESVTLRRHVLSFFQANRYLVEALAAEVARGIPEGSRVVDLYAGTGLFALTAALVRRARVTAVEGDRFSALDLAENSRHAGGRVASAAEPVETFLGRLSAGPQPDVDVLIVDPPRSGMSRQAIAGALGLRAPRVIYVSCDVATFARDARRLIDTGYRLARLTAFDLFPNTPHVETAAVFELA